MPTDRPLTSRSISAEAANTADTTPSDRTPTRHQHQHQHRRSLTQNACVQCKKSRVKCNGAQPCARCAGRDSVECVYVMHKREAKEKMYLEIERLQAQAAQYERIFHALRSSQTIHTIRQQLEDGEPLEKIAHGLDQSTSLKTEAKCLSARPRFPSTASDLSEEPPQAVHSTLDSVHAPLSSQAAGSSGSAVIAEPWTRVTANEDLIEHLLSLYFCWEYPIFTMLSEQHFRDAMERGDDRYWSPLLVNAILAVACRYSDRPESRTIAEDDNTAGDHFFHEAKRLLAIDDKPDLRTVQALGIMSVREGSRGHEEAGWSLAGRSMRMAIYLGLQLPLTVVSGETISSAEIEVRAITFWGSFALDQAWSQCAGRIPQLPRCVIGVSKMNNFITDRAKVWVPYTEENVRIEPTYEQLTDVRSVFSCLCELSELINDSLYLLHPPREPLAYEKILAMHNQYLLWHASLPEALRRGRDSTPAVFVLHIYYQFAIILLFRPFVNLKSSSPAFSPRSLSLEAAVSISILLRCYDGLHTMRRIAFIVPDVILASTATYLADMSNSWIAEPLRFNLNSLRSISVCDLSASRSLKRIKALAWEKSVYVSEEDTSQEIWTPAEPFSLEHWDLRTLFLKEVSN